MKRNSLYALAAAACLAIIAFLFFFPDDVQGNVLQQADIQQGLANGQEGKAFTEATGETTRWTNSLFSGMPNFQIAPSYASSTLLDWIAKVYTLGLPSPANLLFAIMLGFFIMCLCLKTRWQTALFGALAWGFSTYFIILIGAGHIWKFVTLAYIPPTIGGIILCYRGKYLGGAALAALFGALQLQSNHPQMSYYFMFVIVAMMIAWLVNAIREHDMKRWLIATGCTVAAGVIAVGANATGLYNTYEYSKETIRGRATELTAEGGQQASGLDKEYITGWSYGIDETLTLLIPNVKGGATIKPVGGNNEIKSLAETDKAAEYSGEEQMLLSQRPQYFGDQPMTNGPVYVGAIVLLLAVLALLVVPGPMKWALFAVGVLAIFLSWGHNFMLLSDLFIDYFPGYNKFRTVSSILVIIEFTIPLLAVMCLGYMLKKEDFFKQYKSQTLAVFGVGAFICLLGAIAPSIFGSPFSASEIETLGGQGLFSNPKYSGVLDAIRQTRLSLVRADSIRSLIYIIIGGLLIYLYSRKAFSGSVMVLALAAVMCIDLFTVNKRYVDSANFVPQAAETGFVATAADNQILADTAMNYRVMDVDNFSGARSSYFHKTIGGYHAAKLTRYNDLIEHQIAKNNMGVLNMLNAKYFIMGDSVIANPDANGNAWFVDRVTYVNGADAEMKGLDSLDTRHAAVADASMKQRLGAATPTQPGDTIFETSYAPNRLTYHAQSAKGGLAVFSEVFFPWGWSATIDGKPAEIGRVDYVLRALKVPAGKHSIVFEFQPQSVKRAETISVVSIILIYILLGGAASLAIVGWRRRKKTPDAAPQGNDAPERRDK